MAWKSAWGNWLEDGYNDVPKTQLAIAVGWRSLKISANIWSKATSRMVGAVADRRAWRRP